jgi:thioredoxin-like negative regulator of GroEL
LLRVADLVVEPAIAEAPHSVVDDYHTDASAVAQAAFALAKSDGRRVLLDFGAVWCPPCNRLAAEVLHAEPAVAQLEPFHVAVLDADDPTSFALKHRYGVGGYPTVIAVEPDGTEVRRLLGYPGRQQTLEWLDAAATQQQADVDPATTDPSSMSPEEAADIAWLLVQRAHEDVGPWLERAASAEDSVSLHLARISVNATVDDATWLVTHAPGRAMDWVWAAKALAETDGGSAVLRRALQDDLRQAHGAVAADLLYLLAEMAPESEAQLLYGSAAVALRTEIDDDWEHNRGHLTWLAVLMERSGDVDGALALLQRGAETWPTEPTFHLAAARMLLRLKQHQAALEMATDGMDRAWGDNALRLARHAADALLALERGEEAISVATAALAAAAPADDLDVRTHRYRLALQDVIDGTSEEVP